MAAIAPSILTADFANLKPAIETIEAAGVKYLHLDVMDGMFVPQISFGLPVVSSIRACTDMILDVHLMIEDPDRYIRDFADAGADIITVHAEACRHLDRTVQLIHDCGKKAGVAINPATPICAAEWVLERADLVLLMTVNPGFGGQKIIPYAKEKIESLADLRDELELQFTIEIDGGVKTDNIVDLCVSGADLCVTGSAVFDGDMEQNLKEFMELVKE